ncbi:hypothetical protein TRIUR3_33598 [Triticum urartu]|uniref:Uncharacterized protein n=1 Tax=Triticum urartu TaxID=4572 RepID=M8A6U4_TRIUA|nr:hypothetical protein TRIUR3_33598 [Triticum urartu]
MDRRYRPHLEDSRRFSIKHDETFDVYTLALLALAAAAAYGFLRPRPVILGRRRRQRAGCCAEAACSAEQESGGAPESNPFAARAVRIYLREVRDSHAKARGIPHEKKKRKRAPQAAEASGSSAGAGAVFDRDVEGSAGDGTLAASASQVGAGDGGSTAPSIP